VNDAAQQRDLSDLTPMVDIRPLSVYGQLSEVAHD